MSERSIGRLLLAGAVAAAVVPPGIAGERPRTALVLSGGGARGAAHVGVLQVLEERGVTVDCVVGTSMGSIVGGLYATGWSPADLETQLAATDWKDAFDDAPSRKRTPFRRKQDDFLPLIPLELGLNRRGLQAPTGLIAGQKLGFMLKILSLRAAAAPDFDQLALPFRAVAADLDDGSMVVLGDGSLAEAMRASMSIPGVFTPVQIGDRTLVDGGIVRNLPIDVGRALCADRPGDRVIAVDIGTPPRQLRNEETFLSVAAQTFSVINKRNVAASRAQLTPADLLVAPELGDVAAASFDRVGEAIERGRLAAEATATELARFAVEPAQFDAWRDRLRAGPVCCDLDLHVVEIEVRGTARVDPRQITSRLHIAVGEELQLDRLEEDLGAIYQVGEFEHVDFQFEPAVGGTRLVIVVEEKSWGPGYLRPGLRLESNLQGDSEFLALANYRRSQLNHLGAEWKTVLTIGGENRLFTELFQPFDHRGFTFIAPFAEVSRDELVDPTGELGNVEFELQRAGVDLGVQFGNYGELRFGVEVGSLSVETTGVATLADADIGGFRSSWTLDRLDNTEFPRDGSLVRADFFRSDAGLGADLEYERLAVELVGAWPVGRGALFASASYGSNLSTELPDYNEFSLGGFFNLSGLPPEALRGDALALMSVGFYRQIAGGLYLGGAIEAGDIWQDADDIDLGDLVYSGIVYLGRKTFVGPLYVGYASTDDADDTWYFFLGRTFG